MAELLLSSESQHYWESNGAQQKEYDRLYENLVPVRGMANSYYGEVLRGISRLYHEFCNNGNGNALNEVLSSNGEWIECDYCNGTGEIVDDDGESITCDYCDGDGGYYDDDDYDYVIKDMYENFIQLIREFFVENNCTNGVNAINNIEKIILYNGNCSQENMSEYDKVVDYIIWIILNNEENNKEIPEWYVNKEANK